MEEFESLSVKAYKDIELTEFADVPEKYAYFRLKNLYYRYKCGDYTKEKAMKIKEQIKKEYVQDSNKYESFFDMFKEYNKNRIENESLLYKWEKETDKEKLLQIAAKIISNCVNDDTLIDRFEQKFGKIDF